MRSPRTAAYLSSVPSDERPIDVKAKLVSFGVIEIDGERFEHDVVIEHGKVTKRKKGPSKPLRGKYGHTPLSPKEDIPWSGRQLIVGTGYYGDLPLTPDLTVAAAEHNVHLVARRTEDACKLLRDLDATEVNAVLHVTC